MTILFTAPLFNLLKISKIPNAIKKFKGITILNERTACGLGIAAAAAIEATASQIIKIRANRLPIDLYNPKSKNGICHKYTSPISRTECLPNPSPLKNRNPREKLLR